ncbi:MAG TPA: FtsX-like permease family protein, partial [Longimicrobiales bacterium]|nr:FtsX-like permease family protein [Longimicrobiales bacterium]
TGLIRLRDGVTLERAQAELDVLQASLVAAYPENNAGRVARLVPLATDMTGGVRRTLLLALAAVGVVLLVACANVANLLLLRAATRQHEVSLRGALGASRARVVRQLVTESLMLALLGGVAGTALAYAVLPVLTSVTAGHLPRVTQVRVDGSVLMATTLLTLVVGVLFGMAPTLEMSRASPRAVLVTGARATATGRRARQLLLGVQVALCVTAVSSAALLTRTVLQLRAVDPGLDARDVLTLELRPSDLWPVERYDALHDELRRRIGALPGVRAVGATSILPMSGSFNGVGYSVLGEPPPQDGQAPGAEARSVTPEFFDALSIGVVAGRSLERGDVAGREPVIVVSRTLAERHFGSAAGALGRALIRNDDTLRIVGVVADVHQFTLDQAPEAAMYMPDAQAAAWMRFPIRLVVRTDGDPRALAPSVRAIARELDERMPVSRVQTMAEVVVGSYAGQRARSLLFSAFAAITLLLATVGVYGTVAYDVARRRQEIGVRMALGASRGGVARMLLRQALRPVLLGAAVGVAAALATGRLLTGLLFNVSAADPIALAAAPLLLLATAGIAAWWPAQRAAGVAPGIVLRDD